MPTSRTTEQKRGVGVLCPSFVAPEAPEQMWALAGPAVLALEEGLEVFPQGTRTKPVVEEVEATMTELQTQESTLVKSARSV